MSGSACRPGLLAAILTLALLSGCGDEREAGRPPGGAATERAPAGDRTPGRAGECERGESLAGLEDVSPQGRFDGVSAAIQATRPVAGLAGQEHVSGIVGIGDSTGLYVSAGLGGFVDGSNLAFFYEYGTPGDFAYEPLERPAAARPGEAHVVTIRRLRGSSWVVEVNGRRVARPVELFGSHRGLAYPHAFLSSTNIEIPCDNDGGFLFTKLSLLGHGRSRWQHFPLRTQVRAWPGYDAELLSRSSFRAESRS